MNNFIVAVILSSFDLLHSFLDFQLRHPEAKDQRGDYSSFVQQLALPFVERKSVKDPSSAAVSHRTSLFNQSHQRLITQAFSVLHLIHNCLYIGVFMFFYKFCQHLFSVQYLKPKPFLDSLSKGALSRFSFPNDVDNWSRFNIFWNRIVLLQGLRVSGCKIPLFLIFQIVDSVLIDERVGLGILDKSVRIELAKSAIRHNIVVDKVLDPVPLNGQHIIFLPSIDPVLDVGFQHIVDPICDMLYLSLAFYVNHLNSQSFEGFSIFLDFGVVSLPLSFESLFLLSNHLLKFGNLRVLLFSRLVVLLSSLKCFLLGLLPLILLLDSLLLFYVL